MKRRLLTSAGISAAMIGAAALLFGAGTAQADDQSYLDQLSHVNTLWMTPQDKTSMGHMICGWIRGGQNPADIAQQIKGMDGPGIVAASQQQLCPDTLH